jgi:hypothetical protein
MAAAEEWNTELLFGPAGGTNGYQPLDYHIYWELKLRSKAEITRLMALRHGVNIACDQGVSISAGSWDTISSESIRKAWRLPSLALAVVTA